MRYVVAALTLAVVVLNGAAPALAEKRVFIIENNPDGYGVDRCLATGETCGVAVATAYCQAQEFVGAASFRKVGRSDFTGVIPSSFGRSEDFVAIECQR